VGPLLKDNGAGKFRCLRRAINRGFRSHREAGPVKIGKWVSGRPVLMEVKMMIGTWGRPVISRELLRWHKGWPAQVETHPTWLDPDPSAQASKEFVELPASGAAFLVSCRPLSEVRRIRGDAVQRPPFLAHEE
jgi:hypothetical protein